jgi:hypothetical protein
MKPHQLVRLTESIYSRPHLISQAGFNSVSAFLNARNSKGLMVLDEYMEEMPDEIDDFDPMMGVGVIDIMGTLSYKPVND